MVTGPRSPQSIQPKTEYSSGRSWWAMLGGFHAAWWVGGVVLDDLADELQGVRCAEVGARAGAEVFGGVALADVGGRRGEAARGLGFARGGYAWWVFGAVFGR